MIAMKGAPMCLKPPILLVRYFIYTLFLYSDLVVIKLQDYRILL